MEDRGRERDEEEGKVINRNKIRENRTGHTSMAGNTVCYV